MTFTIITGPGRCGSSALTQFFINSNKYRIDSTGFNPKMRAGYESEHSILANSLLYSSRKIPATRVLAIHKIFYLYNTSDIAKSPTFFYLNTYHEWQKTLKNYKGIQVILLKRDANKVIESAKKIKSNDWDNIDPTQIDNLWEENITTLDNLSIPYITLEYPKFTKDSNYLYNNLLQLDLGNWKFSLEDIENLMHKSFY